MARERGGEAARSLSRPVDQGLTIADLRHLITLMQNSDIEEISVERESDDLRLRLRKPAPQVAETGPAWSEAPEAALPAAGLPVAAAAAPAAAEPDAGLIPVTAPLVGRFHLGIKPGAPPLVAAGDIVRPGQVVGTIETLNLFNEVEAGHAGRVVTVVAAEGQPVEYGQVLVQIEPLAPHTK
jgi:acetyl-CoA carboxylase biotin carboxyl carrier protein